VAISSSGRAWVMIVRSGTCRLDTNFAASSRRFEDGTTRLMLSLPADSVFATLELVHDPGAGPLEIGNGLSHIAVQVGDLAATLADLAAKGLAPGQLELPAGEHGPKTSTLLDPDGYRIERVEWPPGHPDGLTRADFE
jgi:lactoylglutathione lyase